MSDVRDPAGSRTAVRDPGVGRTEPRVISQCWRRPEACCPAGHDLVVRSNTETSHAMEAFVEVFLGMLLDAAGAEPGLPDLDDRLVEPGTRHEMLDGRLVHVPPADAPHAERQFQLCPLIEAHTGPEFKAACELLTRISRGDDVAPDVSVYPAARDPVTGRRQLEQLAF